MSAVMTTSETTERLQQSVLRLTVNNHPGVMSAVCGLFSRRSYNLEGIMVRPPFVGAVAYNLGSEQIGLYLMLTPLGYIVGNFISGRFSTVLGLEKMLIIGCLVVLLPMLMCLAVITSGSSHPMGFFAFTLAIGLGNGMVLPSATAGMLDVNPSLAGSASGLGGAVLTLGGAAFSAAAAFFLTETSGALPLVLCVILASACALLLSLYTIRVERQVRGYEIE